MQVSSNRNVLIAGAGIAGPTLAYWLMRYGFQPTLVEVAPSLRAGGYMIDFWGLGYDVAEKMGLIAKLRGAGYEFTELRLVDGRGRRLGGLDARAFKSLLGSRFFSILRADLAREVFRTIENGVEMIFDDSIASIEKATGAMNVAFRNGATRAFDLVIGADGLHSGVRSLVFGEEDQFEKYLGYHVASFTVADYPNRIENVYVSYTVPGRQVARYALRGNRTAFLFVFAGEKKLDLAPHDLTARKQILRNVFQGGGWETGKILDAMDAADDLYFDSVSQVRMPQWSRERVALIGDAAFCPSLLAGQGAGFAMAAAYMLAGELFRARGDYGTAFDKFERQFRPFIGRKQRAAKRLGAWFAPKTRLGLGVRNAVTRMMSLPTLGGWMLNGMLADRLVLPDYES